MKGGSSVNNIEGENNKSHSNKQNQMKEANWKKEYSKRIDQPNGESNVN